MKTNIEGLAYVRIMELADQISSKTIKRQLISEEYLSNGHKLSRDGTGAYTLGMNIQFVQVSNDLQELLTPPALLFIAKHLMFSLKRYNVLWYFPTTSSRDYKILKELRAKRVIFNTEVPAMYIVNPTKIWRGTIHSAVECTKQLLRDNGKRPHPSLIRDLKPLPVAVLHTPDDLFARLTGTEDIDHEEPLQLGE